MYLSSIFPTVRVDYIFLVQDLLQEYAWRTFSRCIITLHVIRLKFDLHAIVNKVCRKRLKKIRQFQKFLSLSRLYYQRWNISRITAGWRERSSSGLSLREPDPRTRIISLGAAIIDAKSARRAREKERDVWKEGRLFAHHSKESAPHRDLPIPRHPQPHAVKSNLHCPPDFGLLLNAEEARAHSFPSTARIMKSWPIFERDCLR